MVRQAAVAVAAGRSQVTDVDAEVTCSNVSKELTAKFWRM